MTASDLNSPSRSPDENLAWSARNSSECNSSASAVFLTATTAIRLVVALRCSRRNRDGRHPLRKVVVRVEALLGPSLFHDEMGPQPPRFPLTKSTISVSIALNSHKNPYRRLWEIRFNNAAVTTGQGVFSFPAATSSACTAAGRTRRNASSSDMAFPIPRIGPRALAWQGPLRLKGSQTKRL
jgi:hypothetical protein